MKAAFAAKRAERKQEMLARFDLNKDGALDKTERAAMRDTLLTERFQKLDTNGDGTLSLDEFKAGTKLGPRHARFGHRHHHAALQGTAPAVK
jgi:Ca2+-binding EF-hand superfamily protein